MAEALYPESNNPVIGKMQDRWTTADTLIGVGLDPQPSLYPPHIAEIASSLGYYEAIAALNEAIIDAAAPYVVDFKVNANFYHGPDGARALEHTFRYLGQDHPGVVRVYDAKFADVSHTAEQMANYVFGELNADAVMLNPYLGSDAIAPFAAHRDKLVILCVNTSNPSASEVQGTRMADGRLLWEQILDRSLNEWNGNRNVIPVLSATHHENLVGIRKKIGDSPILLAGVGSQGGDAAVAMRHCLDSKGYGLMIGSSRSIMYPPVKEGETYEAAVKKAVLEFQAQIRAAQRVAQGKS